MLVAAAFSRLVEEGVARWDEPAMRVIPEFRLSDESLRKKVTFRDLAGMRVGLTREGADDWGFRQDVPKEARRDRALYKRRSGRFGRGLYDPIRIGRVCVWERGCG